MDASRWILRAISVTFTPHQSRAKNASCARGFHPRSLPSGRGQIFGATAMNPSDRIQQFFKSYLLSAWSDLALRRSLRNPLNEFLIPQKCLIDGLVITLLVIVTLLDNLQNVY